MTLFDKLNLKPGERRVVLFVALLVFVVLNGWFVWPKFFELGRLHRRQAQALGNLQQFQREVDRIPQYERRLRELEQLGAAVASEDQASKLQTTVYSQAALSGVQVNNYIPQPRGSSGARTNIFFDETSGTIQFVAEEKNLVDFLYNLGIGGSLIRVKRMSLNPDPPRQRLQGSITLVASFARKAPPKAATPAPATPAAATARPPGTGGAAPKSINAAMKPAASNAPPAQKSWLSRLWPFGNKPAAAPAKTNATARTNAPATTKK
jgi:hypothetical protein